MSNVPSHWSRGRMKWDTTMVAGGTPPTDNDDFWLEGDDPSGTPFVAIADMSRREHVSSTAKSLSVEGMESKSMPLGSRGTLLLAMYASVGEVAFLDIDATWNQALLGIRPDPSRVDARFLRYMLLNLRDDLLQGVRTNTQANLNASQIGSLWFDRPPLHEQRVIADFLDRETARIDTLIEEQQRLIELLRERRVSVRSNACLGLLDGSVLTDTNLPWATRVPSDWKVVPLTSVARLESGHTPSKGRQDWWENCRINWVSLHDVGAMRGVKYLAETAQRISDLGIANSSARVLPAGTVVLSRDATVGRTAIMRGPMATSQHFAAWVCGPRLDPQYLWALFSDAMQPFFNSFQNGSTIRTIGMGDLKAFRVPLPSLIEQQRIVKFLDEQTATIDELITETERFIDLARERRSALITAAVTGQIDVGGE